MPRATIISAPLAPYDAAPHEGRPAGVNKHSPISGIPTIRVSDTGAGFHAIRQVRLDRTRELLARVAGEGAEVGKFLREQQEQPAAVVDAKLAPLIKAWVAPDWISPPGDTIEDLLEERSWTKAEFAERTGFTPKHINELVKGRVPITADAAERLSRVLGSTSDFWLVRDAQYQAACEHDHEIRSFIGGVADCFDADPSGVTLDELTGRALLPPPERKDT